MTVNTPARAQASAPNEASWQAGKAQAKADPKKFKRLSGWGPRPARLVHRGFDITDADMALCARGILYAGTRFGAYGVDQVITGCARPFLTPVVCARRAAAERRSSGVAVRGLAGTLGGMFGLGKGLVGGAVCAASGVGALVESAGLTLLFYAPVAASGGIVRAGSASEARVMGAKSSV